MKLASLLTLSLLVWGAIPASGAETADLNRQVLEMLEADLSEEVILEWLRGVDSPPRQPSADELIALKKAGATDRLLQALIALPRDQQPVRVPAATALESTRAPAAAQEVEAAPEPPPTALVKPTTIMEAPRPAASERAQAGVLVTFRLSYQAPKVDFEEELWDLYVYLDGKPLAYVPPTYSPLDREAGLEFNQRLAPGRHVLRVAQERHEKRRGGKWRHSARVATQEFVFELAPGEPAKVDLTYWEGWLANRSDGPLRFRLVQEEQVAELEWVGGNPEGWPFICEELESDGRRAADCVYWQELWGDMQAPSRAEVREALEMFDYRPVPLGT